MSSDSPVCHSEEIQRELDNCRRFLTDAEDNQNPSQVAQFLRLFAGLHHDLEKARIREGRYMDARAIAAHDTRFMAGVIEEMRGYLQKLYDRELTPDQAWQQLVDKLIGESDNA